jgi:hypothetical protein
LIIIPALKIALSFGELQVIVLQIETSEYGYRFLNANEAQKKDLFILPIGWIR